MKNKLQINIVLGLILLMFIAACRKEDVLPAAPDKTVAVTETSSSTTTSTGSTSTGSTSSTGNDTVTTNNNNSGANIYPNNSGDISFAGMAWHVRTNSMAEGPGPNLFSGSGNNVWVDGTGALHLKITNQNGVWKCSELTSANTFGYGTYAFTVGSNVAAIDRNVVAGLFTWDDNTFATQANSEVDIEFSKWGNASDQYTYTSSVQPVKFDNPAVYYERTSQPSMDMSKLTGTSTHAFTWTNSQVIWKSYEGANYPGSNLIASWQFNNTMQPRIKYQSGQQSAPVVIPAPGNTTKVHINLWLINGQAPSNGQEVELVVRGFRYMPINA
jgi:hypothetical protein